MNATIRARRSGRPGIEVIDSFPAPGSRPDLTGPVLATDQRKPKNDRTAMMTTTAPMM
jgi:hypothetical protein